MGERHVTLTVWEDGFDWSPAEAVRYTDVHRAGATERSYAAHLWASPVTATGFAAAELIPSWNARTPGGSWLLVEARLESDFGWTPWLTFGRWCERLPDDGGAITRTTVPGQRMPAGQVAADTFEAAVDHRFTAWQVRLTGLVASENDPYPEVTLVTAAVSAIRIADAAPGGPGAPGAPGEPGRGGATELVVPPHSQRLHVGSFPEWDGGGTSWCSPASTTMVLEHWGVGPAAHEVTWVGHDTDAAVVHAVSRVFDQSYGGAGNWAFNVAYAATRGLRAYVTRLRDLTEAEAFVAAGIPLVLSVSFTSDQLDGAGYDTAGHLLTVIGFTAAGDVVSNDPNSHRIASNEQVRTVYRRDQFEKIWLGDDGGLTYVIHPRDVPLPSPPSEANWA